uniref:Uncharacterized protein n=1 Tax=Onchocerca volvulus TaxID=6282 RepID=A0A8R1U2M9_ONCVO
MTEAIIRRMIRSYYIIVLFLILFVTCNEGNTTNLDIRDEKHVVIKYVAVLLFIFFLLYSIISNSLMATTVLFCRKQDSPYSQAFVLIALQLIISNFASFIPQIVVVLPEILQNQNSTNGKLFYLHLTDIFTLAPFLYSTELLFNSFKNNIRNYCYGT